MSMIEGRLHLGLLPDKSVRLVFSPHTKGTNSRPLEIKNTGFLLSDLESIWGFTPSKANAAIAQLEGMDTWNSQSPWMSKRSTNCFCETAPRLSGSGSCLLSGRRLHEIAAVQNRGLDLRCGEMRQGLRYSLLP